LSSKMLAGEKILCVFPDAWGNLKRGRHQIIERLLINNEVLIIEDPSMSILSLSRDRNRISRLWSWLRVRRPKKNLLLYTPLLALPFIFNSEKLRKITEWLLCINIRFVLKISGFKPTLLYLSTPLFDGFIDGLEIKRTLYVAHDAWEVYPYGQQFAKSEVRTLKKVGLAIFNAKPNMERKNHFNKHSYYVPHGCPMPDVCEQRPHTMPVDFPKFGELVLGYWGAIDKDCVDIELLDWLADYHPEWTIVLVGGIYERDKAAFEKIQGKKNIIFLGRKKQEERYDYLRCFDIALLCACPTDVELKASQLKFWEYASIGLPIVGIPIEEYIGYDWFYAAHDRPGWVKMIIRAAQEDTSERRKLRIDFARANTWEQRVEQISSLVQQVLPRNNSK